MAVLKKIPTNMILRIRLSRNKPYKSPCKPNHSITEITVTVS